MKSIENQDDYQSIIEKEENIIISFYAKWCNPSKPVKNIIKKIKEETENLTFLDIDMDLFPEIAKRYNVKCTPSVLFFHKGSLVDKEVGLQDKNVYLNTINSVYRKYYWQD